MMVGEGPCPDQFGAESVVSANDAKEVLSELQSEYGQLYYNGVICERWAKARLKTGAPGSVAYGWFIEAMSLYEKAEAIRPRGNEDAILRWNACARIIERDERLKPRAEEERIEDDADGPPIR